MANFKRKRPKSAARGRRPRRMSSWPAWWDVVFHRRPARRRASRVTRAVLAGRIEWEAATWDPQKKPHRYYW